MAVTLTQLVAFLTVVRRGSVTAAAEELVVTQPSVSAAVSALERELGVRLTERFGRTVRPTAAGAAYAPYASDVLGLLAQGARVAREAEEARPNTLRISAVTTAGEYLVPQLIQAFRERRPDLEISLDVGNRELVFQRVLDHQVDVAVTGRIPDDERLVGVDFADNEFTIVTAAGDPLARRRWVAMEELASRPWLLREPGSGTRTLCEEFLARRGIEPTCLRSARTERSSRPLGQGSASRFSRARPWNSNWSWDCSTRSAPAADSRSAAGTWSAPQWARYARTWRRSWASAPHRQPGTRSPARPPPGQQTALFLNIPHRGDTSGPKGAPQAADKRLMGDRRGVKGVCAWVAIIVAALSLAAVTAAPASAADRAYAKRFGVNDTGDVRIVGNTSMSCATSASCTSARAGTGTTSNLNNDAWNMAYVDVDSDATTFSSSRATLDLPAGATVLFAGLYWGGDAPAAAARDQVKFDTPAPGGYQDLVATTLDTSTTTPTAYQGFRDVTGLVAAVGAGDYWVANVQGTAGRDQQARRLGARRRLPGRGEPAPEPRRLRRLPGRQGRRSPLGHADRAHHPGERHRRRDRRRVRPRGRSRHHGRRLRSQRDHTLERAQSGQQRLQLLDHAPRRATQRQESRLREPVQRRDGHLRR